MYRTVDTSFWTDPKIRSLTPEEKLLCLYLVTSPHGHLGGLYYIPNEIVLLETGLSNRKLDTLWDTLSGAGFCKRDKKLSVVWVIKMFFYQGKGIKNEKAVANHIATLHNSFLVNEFLSLYPSVKRWLKDRVSDRVCHRVSEFGTQEQEQEQEQEKDREQEQEQEQEVAGATICRPASETITDILTVFGHYKTYHPDSFKNPSSSSREWQKIRDRLAEGYTADDLKAAIDGCHLTPHNLGANDNDQKYLGLELIMRNGSQVSRFIENSRCPPRPRNERERRTLDAAANWLNRSVGDA